MSVKAVIFDMDGLMINSEVVTYEAFRSQFEPMGFTYPHDFYVGFIGKKEAQIMEAHYKRYGRDIDMPAIMQNVYRYIADYFKTNGVPVKDGLRELLQYLKDEGIPAVVATSSKRERVDDILKDADLTQYFKATVCGDEVKMSKPDPEIFIKACEKIGVAPAEAIVLEDSEAGIEAAHNAAIPVICVPDMKYPEDKYAKMTLKIEDSLYGVKDFLASGLSGSSTV